MARALLLALLHNPPAGYRVEPVYLSVKQEQWVYMAARSYTLSVVDSPPVLYDSVVDFQAGDVVLGLDISGQSLIQAQQSGLYERLQQQGVKSYFMLYDLLPLQLPEVFPAGAATGHEQWLRAVAQLDGIVAISKAVRDDFLQWCEEQEVESPPAAVREWVHLGADVEQSAPSTGLPADAEAVLTQLAQHPTFLMVGTIEPRKYHQQALAAFELLWEQGLEVNLVIVGNEGWQSLANTERRTIPQTVQYMQALQEKQPLFLWLSGISDEYLERIYAASTCLLMPSLGEGFGLPLIEAAQHQLPMIVRDLPIFREVAGAYATYFSGLEAQDLATAVQQWLQLYEQGQHPTSEAMPWLTWEQSAQQLVKKLPI